MATVPFTPADRAIESDHRRLEQLLARLRDDDDLPTLLAALDELNATLVPHFAHEETPGGPYDVLSGALPEFKVPLGELMDEHYQLLATARELATQVRLLLQVPRGLRERVRHLADDLADHTHRENEILAHRLQEA